MVIRINTHGNEVPVKKGDWIDLYTAEEAVMFKGDYRVISLGVSMKLPEGCEAHILPRSSTFKNWGILMTNGMGIVDNKYCGDDDVWGFPCYAVRNTKIPKGTRIAQFRVMPVCEPVEFEAVESLGEEARGGFGSTGK